MIPLFKVRVSENVGKPVTDVLHSGFIGQGQKVEDFEDLLQIELNSKTRPVTVNSCTSAIDLALELIGVGPDDEVISTPQTCFASQVGAIHRHAKIRWADIDPITGLIDVDSVSSLITEKTKAIICVNWAGKLCDFASLKRFNIPIVEDAAHTWDIFDVSGIERGDYICYSLQAIKFLTTGDGGILICPPEKESEARILRWFGLDRNKGQSFRCTQNITKAGFKYQMNDIAAAIGISNLPEAKKSVHQQRKNAKHIIDNVNNPNLILPEWDETCSYWLFSMHVLNNRKQEFVKYLEEAEISSSPVHFRNDMYSCTEKFKERHLPGVTDFDKTQICIPNGWWLTNDDLEHIVKVLNKFY
jgi:dTDP-4-amino-4,6-dideoxygalactose transaminase